MRKGYSQCWLPSSSPQTGCLSRWWPNFRGGLALLQHLLLNLCGVSGGALCRSPMTAPLCYPPYPHVWVSLRTSTTPSYHRLVCVLVRSFDNCLYFFERPTMVVMCLPPLIVHIHTNLFPLLPQQVPVFQYFPLPGVPD